ncbi:MAG: polyprenyl synthetase family protein [Actinobacteria bacterium]|jgi:heptaprenyl diphosphate synthase|nr:polyprenyl synthetase family protein [Actinomycetota bacterium]
MVTLPSLSAEVERDLTARMKAVEEFLYDHAAGTLPFATETSRHLISAGGKRFRPLLTLLASNYGDPTREEIIKAAVVVELTHLATLYHDDVMDEAPLRRGVESANKRWGNSVAILTGDYLFAKSSLLLADLGPDAVRHQAMTFERLVIGQIMETQGAPVGEDALEHYLRVVAEKTGSLFGLCARYGGYLSGAHPEIVETLVSFSEELGIAFQLADDVIDIESSSNQSGKTPGTDLREGVPTLVTLLVQRMAKPDDSRLLELLAGPITNEDDVTYALKELRSHQALSEAKKITMQYAESARKKLATLPLNGTTEGLLTMCDALVSRSA